MQNIFWCGLLTLVYARSASAYVDPGSASMALQMLVGGVVAALFVLKSYFHAAKAYVAGLFAKGDPKEPVETDGNESVAQSKTSARIDE